MRFKKCFCNGLLVAGSFRLRKQKLSELMNGRGLQEPCIRLYQGGVSNSKKYIIKGYIPSNAQ